MDGPRTKVELFAAIRRDSRTEKLSIHELSRRGTPRGAAAGDEWTWWTPPRAVHGGDCGGADQAVHSVRSVRCICSGVAGKRRTRR